MRPWRDLGLGLARVKPSPSLRWGQFTRSCTVLVALGDRGNSPSAPLIPPPKSPTFPRRPCLQVGSGRVNHQQRTKRYVELISYQDTIQESLPHSSGWAVGKRGLGEEQRSGSQRRRQLSSEE
jgi:hypothetical protein